MASVSKNGKHFFPEAIFIGGMGLLFLYWLTPFAAWLGKFHLGSQVLAFAWILMLAPILIHGQLKTLAFSPLERAGKISFSLYLLNPPVIFVLSQAGLFKFVYSTFPMPNVAFGICLLLTLCVLWILSELTYHLIEEKGILLGNNLLSESKAQASSDGPQSKPALHSRNTKIIFFLAALPWLFWWGLTMVPPVGQGKQASGQSTKPQIDAAQTKALFASLARKSLGSTLDIENRPAGIFIHPGGEPTEAVFDIAGKFQTIRLVGFITELPLSGLEDPRAGTTGVEIFVDGKSLGLRPVDRFTNEFFPLDLTHAKELKVLVDCSNGTANWDHFYLGISKEGSAPIN